MNMKLVKAGNIEVYRFSRVLQSTNIKHAITTRLGGISEGHVKGLNLGLRSDDKPENVTANRHMVARAMGVADDKIIFPRQTHSNNIKIITPDNYYEPAEDVDALITNEPGIAICTMSADCVPILVHDPEKKIIATVHAGWKGTANGILKDVLYTLIHQFNCEPQRIQVGIGPSICAEVYEVGPEVVELFEQNFEQSDHLISKRKGDKAHVNLWAANKTWCLLAGVPETNIEVAGLCTYTHHDLFFSARYDKNYTGRFAGCLVLNE